MCMPNMGKTDVMPSRQKVEYMKAVPDAYTAGVPTELLIPADPKYTNTKAIPKNERVMLSNGQLGTAEDEKKLQEFLKNRGR